MLTTNHMIRNPISIPVVTSAEALLSRYQVVLCDIWGVLHDGVREYAQAGDALERYRASGGIVILLSNSPAPSERVADIIASKHVRPTAWDRIVSSGDLTRQRMAALAIDRIHHIGPDRDLCLFDGQAVERVTPERAQAIVATGLVDDTSEVAEHYRTRLAPMAKRGLPLICANPDRIVDVGGVTLPCAGALADVYEDLGGLVYWEGKPHAHAYDAAVATAERILGTRVERNTILAIGDSLGTDMAGADAAGLDAVFIAQGIHRQEVIVEGTIEPGRLNKLIAAADRRPIAAMIGLEW